MPRFVQPIPPLPPVYVADFVLQAHLDRVLGEAGHKEAAPILEALAADVQGPLRAAHDDAERHPPRLVQYDGWGRRVDRIEVSAGWEAQRRAAARHGVVALPYEEAARRTWGAGARVVQHALLHLYGPESATFSCPVAMADGAATLLSGTDVDPAVREPWLGRLLSRDPELAITSGQWMTETAGGSDVSGTATTAARAPDGRWRLTGEKWFCSATDSAIAIALARPDGAAEGSRGLACFLVPRYSGDAGAEQETAEGLLIHRLKDKLGTRALPSAEVALDGAVAYPVGDPAEPGLARMMRLVQVTRLHNAAAASAGMRRGLAYVREHARARSVFGKPLDAQPLHREILTWLAVDAEAAFALTGLCFSLLGRVEVDADPEAASLLRLAATLAKAATGKLAVASASEYVECFGGNGFIEDTGVPRLLRDAQVLPIWEGTTNVLSLDVVRALGADPAQVAFMTYLDRACATARADGDRELTLVADQVAGLRRSLAAELAGLDRGGPAQAGSRHLALTMAHLLAAGALLDQASGGPAPTQSRATAVAAYWVRRRLLADPC
ncbi:MAG: acyl-CoA dehydrogenase family protein, partial [Mycobacteriales bacterium]